MRRTHFEVITNRNVYIGEHNKKKIIIINQMGLETKLSKTVKFVATGLAGIATYTAVGYGSGELLQSTYVDAGLQGLFHTFKSEYSDLGTLLGFIGFGTGLKMTALLEFYKKYPKIKKVYNKIKEFIKKTKDKTKDKILETKLNKPSSYKSKFQNLGKYFICAGIGLGLGKLVGESFEHISYTNQAFVYLFGKFADIHFEELGDLFTLLGMTWGLRMKPQLELLYTYLADKEKYNSRES